jgi:hypothetical protein
MDARGDAARSHPRKNIDAEETRQKMPSVSVPLRDSVPRRFGERVRGVAQTQSLQQFLYEKTLAMKSQEGNARVFQSGAGRICFLALLSIFLRYERSK